MAVLTFGDRQVDLDSGRIFGPDGEDRLGPTELKLLAYLASKPGDAVSRDELYHSVWGYRDGVISRTLDVYVNRVRLKIEPTPDLPVYLRTLRGHGYSLTPTPSDRPSVPALRHGREDLAAEVRTLFPRGPVTLAGPPGVGKSFVAQQLVDQRTLWVDLSTAPTEEAARGQLAFALDLPPDTDLRRLLTAHSGLLILDAAPRLTAWSSAFPARSEPTLITGLASHRLPQEQVVDVPPLDPEPAYHLFESRCQAIRRRQWTDEEREAAHRVIVASEGFPSILEFAAGLSRALPLSEIADLIQRGERPLGEFGTAVQRAWNLLSPDQHTLLVALTLFEAPFTTSDGLALAPDLEDPLATLMDLVDANWLRWQDTGAARLTWFHGIRSFVLQQRERAPETEQRLLTLWEGRLKATFHDPAAFAATQRLAALQIPNLQIACTLAVKRGELGWLEYARRIVQGLLPAEASVAFWTEVGGDSEDPTVLRLQGLAHGVYGDHAKANAYLLLARERALALHRNQLANELLVPITGTFLYLGDVAAASTYSDMSLPSSTSTTQPLLEFYRGNTQVAAFLFREKLQRCIREGRAPETIEGRLNLASCLDEIGDFEGVKEQLALIRDGLRQHRLTRLEGIFCTLATRHALSTGDPAAALAILDAQDLSGLGFDLRANASLLRGAALHFQSPDAALPLYHAALELLRGYDARVTPSAHGMISLALRHSQPTLAALHASRIQGDLWSISQFRRALAGEKLSEPMGFWARIAGRCMQAQTES